MGKFEDQIEIYKVGLELFTSAGPKIIEELHKRNKRVFLDLKFHDIPNTVTKAAIGNKAWCIHVQCPCIRRIGDDEKCKDSVVELCLKENLKKLRMLGVTVLTSMSQQVLKDEIESSTA